MNKCVYLHIANCDLETSLCCFKKDQIVYVGSGSEYRAMEKASRSDDHLMIWDRLDKKIIKSNLNQDDARDLEQLLISENWENGLLNKSKIASKPITYSSSYLSEYFYLDEELTLRWKVDRFSGRYNKVRHIKCGDKAGHYSLKTGYGTVTVNKKALQTSRVIYSLYHNTEVGSDVVIDHIDNNPSNDHPSNLQIKTYSQNNLNRPSMKLSLSGVRGIHIKDKSFRVQWYENKIRYFKSFKFSDFIKLGYSL